MTGSVQGDPCSDECPALLTGWTGLSVQVSGRCSGGQVHHKQKCSQTHVPTDKHHAFTSSNTCPQTNTTPSHPHTRAHRQTPRLHILTHVPTDKYHAFTSSHTCPQINTTPSHPHTRAHRQIPRLHILTHMPTDKHHAFTSSQSRLLQRRSERWFRLGFGPLFPNFLS